MVAITLTPAVWLTGPWTARAAAGPLTGVAGFLEVDGCGGSRCDYQADFGAGTFVNPPVVTCSAGPHAHVNPDWHVLVCVVRAVGANAAQLSLDSSDPGQAIVGLKVIHVHAIVPAVGGGGNLVIRLS